MSTPTATCTMVTNCVPGRPQCDACKAKAAERTKADRFDAAIKALHACGLAREAEALHDVGEDEVSDMLAVIRPDIQALRARLMDGSDERRYEATATVLKALGELWAVST